MSIFAISDLHLSFADPKPMDVFGDIWKDHAARIAERWDALVMSSDTVLIAGDHSWALRFQDAVPDLEWIASRPGRKLMIRGNHDYWWRRESTNRIRKLMPSGLELLHGNAVVVENVGITGTRGWRIEDSDEVADERVVQRELMYLRRGLAEIPSDVDRRIVVLHYPPFNTDLSPNEFAQLLRESGVDVVVYGHIHGGSCLEGDINGIEYRLATVDHTGFSPVRI